jgi:hypothetical protein
LHVEIVSGNDNGNNTNANVNIESSRNANRGGADAGRIRHAERIAEEGRIGAAA